MIDEQFEIKVLACLYRSKQFCEGVAQHIKPSYFTNVLRHNSAKLALDFWSKYQTNLTKYAFTQGLLALIKSGTVAQADTKHYSQLYGLLQSTDISDWQMIADKVVDFVRDREWRKFIENAVSKQLPKEDFTTIADEARRILDIQMSKDVEVIEYWNDAQIDARKEAREQAQLTRSIGISTGIKKLDDALDRSGWYKKELYLAIGAAKFGKTMFMLWTANMASMQGFNVIYATCETSPERLADRMDAMNAGCEIRWLPQKCKEVADAIKANKPTGQVYFVEYPTKSLTCADLERHIQKFANRGIRIDMVVADYAGIMKPMQRVNDKLYEPVAVLEELRALAVKWEIPVITAGQTNKSGATKSFTTGTDIAGVQEQITIPDGVLTLCGSEDDLKKGEMLVHLSEFRNTPSTTLRIKTSYGMGKFYAGYVGSV